jgi:hypothetical protein
VTIKFDSDPVADQLVSQGYEPFETSLEFSSDHSTRREWAVQTMRPLRVPNGMATDFTPPQNCVVLTFEYASEHWPERYSKIAGRFADALVKLLTASAGPLVRRTQRSLQFVYRLEDVVVQRLEDPSLSYASELYPAGLIARDLNATLVLCVGCPQLPVGNEAEWLAGRSPLNTPRAALPEFDATAASIALVGLVERFAADLTPCGRYLEPARVSAASERDNLENHIGTDPSEWDPTDPRRKSPGLIDRVRALREKFMGKPSQRIDNDELHEALERRRVAARGPGMEMPWLD